MADPVDDLYMLPGSEFTAARDRLAAKLLAAKERDRARAVKALRRPTVDAWVVNQLAHRNGAALRRLLDAGEGLRRAQRRVVQGGSADDLRAATKRRQDVLRELRALAADLLRDAGSSTHLDDVLATLEAASVDPAAAKTVTAGRLSRGIPRPSGFGDFPAQLSLVSTRPASRPAREASAPRKTEAARDARRTRELAAEAKRLEQEATRSEKAAAQVARRTAPLERARREEERRVRELRAELEKAEGRLRDASADLDRARLEAARAAEQATKLRRSAEAARAQAKAEG